jgi:hypothetical protein
VKREIGERESLKREKDMRNRIEGCAWNKRNREEKNVFAF